MSGSAIANGSVDRRLSPSASDGPVRAGFVEGVISRIADVAFDLAYHRPEPSDGGTWISFDAALCGLHSALIALEEISERDGTVP